MYRFRRRGFTLIELVAVLSIISILAIMVIPKVDGILKKSTEARVLGDIQTLVQAVEIYNIEAEADDLISGETTLGDMKNKLLKEGSEYLNTWPSIKIADGNKYIKAEDSTTYSVLVELLKAKVKDK